MRRFRTLAALATSAAILMGLGAAAPAAAGGRQLVTRLSGANEVTDAGVPNQGDPDGRGIAIVRRISTAGTNDKLCWLVVARNIVLPAIGAHIHGPAASTTNAAVLVPLSSPERVGRSHVGMARGCAPVADTTLDAIWANPDRYYVNVHSTEKPAGAVRGQLG